MKNLMMLTVLFVATTATADIKRIIYDTYNDSFPVGESCGSYCETDNMEWMTIWANPNSINHFFSEGYLEGQNDWRAEVGRRVEITDFIVQLFEDPRKEAVNLYASQDYAVKTAEKVDSISRKHTYRMDYKEGIGLLFSCERERDQVKAICGLDCTEGDYWTLGEPFFDRALRTGTSRGEWLSGTITLSTTISRSDFGPDGAHKCSRYYMETIMSGMEIEFGETEVGHTLSAP